MSIEVLSWTMSNSQAKLSDRLVVFALANHAKSDGTNSWPSVETIAKCAFLSERQVQRSLVALEQAGEILQTGKSKYGTKIFSFPRFIASQGGDNLSQTATDDPEGVTNPVENRDQMSPDPSLDPSENLRATRARGNVLALSAPELGSQGIVAAYVDAFVAATGTPAPKEAVGMVARRVGGLISEGIDPDVVLRAVGLMMERRLHPTTLPTLIHEAAAGPRQTPMRYGRGMTTQQILDATKGRE